MPDTHAIRWQILTSGPCPTFVGTCDEAKAYVERFAHLKRGWTGTWHEHADTYAYTYVRRNSNGRALTGFAVTIRPESADIRAVREARLRHVNSWGDDAVPAPKPKRVATPTRPIPTLPVLRDPRRTFA